jgi:hypothetical protein
VDVVLILVFVRPDVWSELHVDIFDGFCFVYLLISFQLTVVLRTCDFKDLTNVKVIGDTRWSQLW